MDDVERSITEGQMKAIGSNEPHAIELIKISSIIDSDGSDRALVSVPLLQVVRRLVCDVRWDADIEDFVAHAGLCVTQEPLIHAPSLICADPNRKTAWHRQIKLFVRLFLCHPLFYYSYEKM